MKHKLKGYSFLFLIAGSIVALDQLTKTIVRTRLGFAESWSPFEWLAPYARIVHWQNTGAAFGMFQGYNLVFSALAILVSIAIIYYYPRVPSSETTLRLAMSMQLGGALGNLVDRVLLGQVIDFVSVMNFPVFNVADASISMGVVVLLLGMWLKDLRKPKKEEPPQSSLQDPLDGSIKGSPGE